MYSMERKGMKGAYNHGIKARISISKVIQTELDSTFLNNA